MQTTKRHATSVLILGIAILTGLARADYSPSYSDFKGARYENIEKSTWDIGWTADIHHKSVEARERQAPAAKALAGYEMRLGRFGYYVFGVDKLDLYLFDLDTRAKHADFWLSVDDEPVSFRKPIVISGKGHYKMTIQLMRPIEDKLVYLRAHATDDIKFTKALLHLPPEGLFPKGIEGVYTKIYRNGDKDGKLAGYYPIKQFNGIQDLRLSDLGAGAEGIPLPRLGVSVDVSIIDRATGDFRGQILADNGSVVADNWRVGIPWCRIISTDSLRGSLRYLNSRKLDTNGDGHWAPKALRHMDTVGSPVGRAYTVIIPATWFDVPAPKGKAWQTLRCDYLARNGKQTLSMPLRKDYRNDDGSFRIGFVHFACSKGYIKVDQSVHKVCVVQSCKEGGIIIGLVDRLADFRCMQIVKGTMRVSQTGEAIQPRYGKKIVDYQGTYFYRFTSNISEFEAFGLSMICNSADVYAGRGAWNLYPPKLVWGDPYVRGKAKSMVGRWDWIIDTCKKYGVDILFDATGVGVYDILIHRPDFAAEWYDKKSNSFTKFRREQVSMDPMNPEARKAREEHLAELYGYLKRLEYS